MNLKIYNFIASFSKQVKAHEIHELLLVYIYHFVIQKSNDVAVNLWYIKFTQLIQNCKLW